MLSFKSENISRSCKILLILIVMVVGVREVKGQYTKVRATYVGPYPANTGGSAGAGGAAGLFGTIGPVGTYDVLTPNDLNDNNYSSNFSTIAAASGGLGTNLGGGAGTLSTVYLNLSFSTFPNERNPIFIKANALSSSRVNAYEQISIQAFSGATMVGSAISMNSMATNSSGYYIFLPIASCNSIRITVTTDNGTSVLGLLGGKSTASIDIYDVYTFDPTCSPPTYTTAAVTGISLGGAVDSPDNAIDGDLNTKSTLSVGLLSLLATIKQTVYFSKVSTPGDAATITFSVPQSVLNLGLFSGITLQAYNGATAVGAPIQISALLSLDLLGLLGNGTRFTGSYVPSTSIGFDRIEISTGAAASLLQDFFIHEVQQTPPKPTFILPGSAPSATICSGSSITLKGDDPGSGNELRWYAGQTGGTLLANTITYTPSPALTATTTYYVAKAKATCTAESERTPVVITVNPQPAAPTGTAATICSGSNGVFQVISPDALYTYNWYTSGAGGSPILTGTNVITASALTTNTTYYLEAVITATGCPNPTRTAVTITVNPLPTATISGTTSACQNVTAPNITFTGANGTAPYTFTYNINGTANTSITTITGNSVTLPVSTSTAGTFSYNLVSVKDNSATQCTQNQTGTATVTINPKPIVPPITIH